MCWQLTHRCWDALFNVYNEFTFAYSSFLTCDPDQQSQYHLKLVKNGFLTALSREPGTGSQRGALGHASQVSLGSSGLKTTVYCVHVVQVIQLQRIANNENKSQTRQTKSMRPGLTGGS